MEPQIKVIKELCLLVLSHSGLNVAEMLSLTMSGRVKLHSGEVRHITADLGGCLVEEQHTVSGSPQTAAAAASVQVPNIQNPAKRVAHQQQQQHQNIGQRPHHDCAQSSGSNEPVPDNPAHAATQPAAAAGGDGNGAGVSDASPSDRQPAAAAAVTASVQPRTFKRKAVNMQLGGRDQTLHNIAKRAQHHSQVPAELSAEDEIRDANAAALASTTDQSVSALVSSNSGKVDSQQTSGATAEAGMSPAHAGHALQAVASSAGTAAMSAFAPVAPEPSSKETRANQQAHKQNQQLSGMFGATTATPTTEATAWPAALATPAAATAQRQAPNMASTYQCAFKRYLDTKRQSAGAPQRYLLCIRTPNMTYFDFITVATEAVCEAMEARCVRATCWNDVHAVLRDHCTPRMCQKLAELHAEVM